MPWIEGYRSKRCSADEAVRTIRSGDCVYIHPGCAEPEQLVKAMVRRAPELLDVTVIHLLTMGTADYVGLEMAGRFRHVAFFAGANVRDAINEGRADFMPVFLSEIEALFSGGAFPIDVALIHVSPPDEHGFCSFGVGVDTTKSAAEHARVVIAQINPKMPRTLGDSFIHLNKIHHIVEVADEILEHPQGLVSDVARRIGRNIADLIDDGSTLQLGIGGQVDFIRGSARSKGGKPIIALPSTAKNGAVSRIVPHLKEGAGVVTSRGDVHYVVTEFGVAFLHGKTIRERCRSLIQIAHPKFREELERHARRRNLI